VLVLDGCTQRYYSFRTDRPAYAPGEGIRLTLVNHTGKWLEWSFCGLRIERHTGSGWVDVPPDQVWCGEPASAISGASASGRLTAQLRIDSKIIPGEYRLRMPEDWGSLAPRGPVTNPFVIEAPPSDGPQGR
jgi:hypothetical protein